MIFRFALPQAKPSTLPYAIGGRARARAVVAIRVIGPTGRLTVNAVLDTGADCCLFAEWVAWRVGIRRRPNAPGLTLVSSVSQTGVATWFEAAGFELTDPAGNRPPFQWRSVVGFTPVGSFGGPIAGILGVNGGLDQVQRVEFDWSALGGPEVVLRT
jgi:hypothetical protein